MYVPRSHYLQIHLPVYTAFTLGNRRIYNSSEEAVAGVIAHLERFEPVGLNFDIRLVKSRAESLSASSALCWLSWRNYPKNGG